MPLAVTVRRLPSHLSPSVSHQLPSGTAVYQIREAQKFIHKLTMSCSSSKPNQPLKEISTFSQSFPPDPIFTEENVPALAGRTVFITGATSGVGLEVAKVAFSHGANVNISGRTKDKIDLAIQKVKETKIHTAGGSVTGIILDLAELASVKESATSFLNANSRLDILVHNAGVMKPPKGSKTKMV